VAASLNNLASTLSSLGRSAEALAFADHAFTMASRLGSPDAWRWGTILAELRLRLGHAAEAVEPLRAAVDGIEARRSSACGLAPEEPVRFVGGLRDWGDPHAILVRAHLALSEPEAACEVLERGRGREMLDLLHGAGADPVARARERARGTGDDAALEALDRAEAGGAAAEAEIVRRVRGTERAAQAEARGEISRLERQAAREAQSESRRGLLRAQAVVHRLVKDVLPAARPLSASELRDLHSEDERLLAYSLGSENSCAFLVGPAGVEVHRLDVDRTPVTEAQVGRGGFGVPRGADQPGRRGHHGRPCRRPAALRADPPGRGP
jgi:hypothetical protein